MVQIICQNTIGCAASVIIRFLVADKHIKGFFFLRNGKDAFLNLIDCLCLFFINATLIAVGILQSRFIVIIIENGKAAFFSFSLADDLFLRRQLRRRRVKAVHPALQKIPLLL